MLEWMTTRQVGLHTPKTGKYGMIALMVNVRMCE